MLVDGAFWLRAMEPASARRLACDGRELGRGGERRDRVKLVGMDFVAA